MDSPIIQTMQVIPVAGYDSMLMTLSGAHAPCFARKLGSLRDSAGHPARGDIHGGALPSASRHPRRAQQEPHRCCDPYRAARQRQDHGGQMPGTAAGYAVFRL